MLVFRSEIESFFGVAAQAQDSAGDGGFVAGKAAVFLQEILIFVLHGHMIPPWWFINAYLSTPKPRKMQVFSSKPNLLSYYFLASVRSS